MAEIRRSAGRLLRKNTARELSGVQRGSQAIDNPVLQFRRQIRMHREAQNLAAEPLGNREASSGARILPVRCLMMQWLRIVDRGRNAFRS